MPEKTGIEHDILLASQQHCKTPGCFSLHTHVYRLQLITHLASGNTFCLLLSHMNKSTPQSKQKVASKFPLITISSHYLHQQIVSCCLLIILVWLHILSVITYMCSIIKFLLHNFGICISSK